MDKRKPFYWMAVETDKYELPLAVADTAEELGKMVGLTKNAIMDSVTNNRTAQVGGEKYVKVRREE